MSLKTVKNNNDGRLRHNQGVSLVQVNKVYLYLLSIQHIQIHMYIYKYRIIKFKNTKLQKIITQLMFGYKNNQWCNIGFLVYFIQCIALCK